MIVVRGCVVQVVNITSTLGSIGIAAKPLTGDGIPHLAAISKMQVAYKASKAALNMSELHFPHMHIAPHSKYAVPADLHLGKSWLEMPLESSLHLQA